MLLLRNKELNLVRLVSVLVTVLYKLNIKTVIYKNYLFPLIWQRNVMFIMPFNVNQQKISQQLILLIFLERLHYKTYFIQRNHSVSRVLKGND